MVSGHPKSIRISRVDGLSTGPSDLGRHRAKVYALAVGTYVLTLPSGLVLHLDDCFYARMKISVSMDILILRFNGYISVYKLFKIYRYIMIMSIRFEKKNIKIHFL